MQSVPLLRFTPVALAVAFTLSGCSPPSEAGSGEDKPLDQAIQRREPTRVRTQPLRQQEMISTLTTTTVVESEREIELYPRVGGGVVELLAEEGDAVEKDQVLARLDDREARAALETAKLDLRQAREDVPGLELAVEEAGARLARAKLAWEAASRELDRNEKAGLISKNELEQLRLTRDTNEADFKAAELSLETSKQQVVTAQTAIDRASLAVEQAELSLSYTDITAPFEGVVAMRSIKIGDAVTMSEPAFVLTDPDDLRAIFYRPQRELTLFRGGSAEETPLEISITAEALPGVTFPGTIQLVSPTIDAESGSFRVTVGIEDAGAGVPGRGLLPGMLVRLSVVTDRHPDALVVPKRALRREGDSTFVFSVSGEMARRHEVREGFSTDEDVEILPRNPEELQPGMPIVVAGNRDLEEGADVLAEAERMPDAAPDDTANDPDGTTSADSSDDTASQEG